LPFAGSCGGFCGDPDAIFALSVPTRAYWVGWPSTLTDAEILERLLALNRQRAASGSK